MSHRRLYCRTLHCKYPQTFLRIPCYSMRKLRTLRSPHSSCMCPQRMECMSYRRLYCRTLHCKYPQTFLRIPWYSLRMRCKPHCQRSSCSLCPNRMQCMSHRRLYCRTLHCMFPQMFLRIPCYSMHTDCIMHCPKRFCIRRECKVRTYRFRYRSTPRFRTPILQGYRRWNGRIQKNEAVK